MSCHWILVQRAGPPGGERPTAARAPWWHSGAAWGTTRAPGTATSQPTRRSAWRLEASLALTMFNLLDA